MAKQIHGWSRRGGAFVSVNVAALPASVFESELFGHVKGSFTGADRDRRGRFELADNGTLFLDEIGELPHDLQAKLLAVAESGELWPVGAMASRRVNVRIVAATNRRPEELRRDLLGRFCAVLRMPTLAERGDAVAIAREWLPAASEEVGRALVLDDTAVRLVEAFRWPGNVRQLHSAIVVAGALSRDGQIGAAELRVALGEPHADPVMAAAAQLGEWFTRLDLEAASGLCRTSASEWIARHCEVRGAARSRRYRLR
jgi:transcriptional regulator with GAF, ATPase, and Fis domain